MLRTPSRGRDAVDVVDEISFQVQPGEVLGLVGESGPARPRWRSRCSATSAAGWSSAAARSSSTARTSSRCRRSDLQQLRGRQVAYVPQDPSSALNPTLKVGTQLREVLAYYEGDDKARDERLAEVLAEVGLSTVPGILGSLPAPALRRPAAAGRAGHGLRLPAAADRARRADHRPRRDHPAPGARNHPATCAGPTGWRPSTSATTWPWSPRSPTTSRCCTRAGVAEVGPAREVFATPSHPYTPQAAAGRPVAGPLPGADRLVRAAAAARQPPAGLLLPAPVRVRRAGVRGRAAAYGRGVAERSRRPLPESPGGRGAGRNPRRARGEAGWPWFHGSAARRAGPVGHLRPQDRADRPDLRRARPPVRGRGRHVRVGEDHSGPVPGRAAPDLERRRHVLRQAADRRRPPPQRRPAAPDPVRLAEPVPGAEPAPDRRPDRGAAAGPLREAAGRRAVRAGGGGADLGRAPRVVRRPATPISSPAASGSGWPSPAR